MAQRRANPRAREASGQTVAAQARRGGRRSSEGRPRDGHVPVWGEDLALHLFAMLCNILMGEDLKLVVSIFSV